MGEGIIALLLEGTMNSLHGDLIAINRSASMKTSLSLLSQEMLALIYQNLVS